MDYQPYPTDDYTEDVRRDFAALNTVIQMLNDLCIAYSQYDTDLKTVVKTLEYVAHNLFGSVTCMHLRDNIKNDTPR